MLGRPGAPATRKGRLWPTGLESSLAAFLRPILGEDQVGASGVWADIIVQHTYKRPTARSHTGPQHVRTYQEDREGMFNQANVAEGKC